ncbi:MAG: HAD family phosphatase [Anaerolineales bacterium]
MSEPAPLTPIRAVIWDLGGVLVRTEDPAPRRGWETRLGLAPRELARLVFDAEPGRKAALGQLEVAEIWRWVGDHLHLDAAGRDQLRDDFFAGDRADEGLIQAIRRLRPRRKTALLSNAWPNLRSWVEDGWKIADAFDEIVISAEEGVAKPDPEIYLRTLRRLGVSSTQAVMIDDLDRNLDAARALGLHTIHFESRDACASELSHLLGETFALDPPGVPS